MRTLLLALAAVGGLLAPSFAAACSCAPPPDPMVALGHSGVVFEGTVIGLPAPPPEGSRQGGPGQVEYRFSVAQSWKGSPGMEVRVFTNSSGAACGRKYQKGETYLIYAQMSEEATISDSICSRTRLLSGAAEDLAALGAGTPPRRRGGATAVTPPKADPPQDEPVDAGDTGGDAGPDAGAAADAGDPAAEDGELAADAGDAEPVAEPTAAPPAAPAEEPDGGDSDEIAKKSCSVVDAASPSGLALLALLGLGLGIRRTARR